MVGGGVRATPPFADPKRRLDLVAHRRHTALVNSTTATWPEWKAAKPGQQVRMNRTGWTGTVVNVNRFGVRVLWNESGYEAVVVAPAFDLTAI